MIEAPIRITAHGDGWHNIPYIRADVAAAQMAEHDARIAELEAAQAWVSVDERLPELNERVWVFTDWSLMEFQAATWAKDVTGVERWIGATGNVTHWMRKFPPPVTDVTL